MKVTLKNGEKETVAGTYAGLVEKLTAGSLTGSAVTLDDAEVPTTSGGTVRFGEIVEWDDAAND